MLEEASEISKFSGEDPHTPATGFEPTALNHTPPPNKLPAFTPAVPRCSFFYKCAVIKHS